MNIKNSKSIIDANKKCSLFHGMNIDRAIDFIKSGKMKGYTAQRFWEDGIYRKENDPEYNSSKWMFGWSFSRCKYKSSKFGKIVFSFDRKKINYNFKVIPYVWQYKLKNNVNYKNELEDFVLSGYILDSRINHNKNIKNIENEIDLLYKELNNNLNSEESIKIIKDNINKKEDIYEKIGFDYCFMNPLGREISLSICHGFFIKKDEDSFEDQRIKELEKHDLFLGFI